MRPLDAIAEDFRRVGVASIVAGLVSGFFQDTLSGTLGLVALILGGLLAIVGYWFHRRAEKTQ